MEHRGRTTREKGYHAEEEGSCSGVGETKGKGSRGLHKELGLGHRGQADEDQAARDLYLGERTIGFHSVSAELTASVSCSHLRMQW